MSSITNVQKAPDMPLASSAMAHLSGVRLPSAGSPMLDIPWDISSPEGIMAFFAERIREVNVDLRNSLSVQQNRGTTIKDISMMTAILAKYDGDKKLVPGSDDFVEFQRLAAEIAPNLGAGADAYTIQKALDGATKPTTFEVFIDATEVKERVDFQNAHPGGEWWPPQTIPQNCSLSKWRLVAHDGPPAGLDAAACKQLSTQVKAIADGLTTDNSQDAIRVQEYVSRISQLTSLTSNIIHSYDERAMTPIQNIK